jgi:hypothetical protein
MKKPLLARCLGLSILFIISSWNNTVFATRRPLVADTLVGQAHLTRLLSEGICTKMTAEAQRTDLSKLSAAESEALLKKFMFAAMGDNFTEFSTLMQQAGANDARSSGERIGQDAVMSLVEKCPASRPLIARLTAQKSNMSSEITEDEKKVLAPIAHQTCEALDAENARQPFQQRAPAARAAEITKILQGTVLSNASELMQGFGEEVLEDQVQAEEMGKKLAVVLLNECPTYVLMMGQASLAQKSTDPPAKAPVAKKPVLKPAIRKK